jgi:hypothetical protein
MTGRLFPPREPAGPSKDGLQSAVEVTKYALALAGGAIAYLLGADTLTNASGVLAKLVISASLLGFFLSAIGGLGVLMRAATQLSEEDYDIANRWISWPGLFNIFGLAFGFATAAVFVFMRVWGL